MVRVVGGEAADKVGWHMFYQPNMVGGEIKRYALAVHVACMNH